MAKEFLIELGTEELPPKQLRTLAEAFATNFTAELQNADIAHDGVTWYATPRRLAEHGDPIAACRMYVPELRQAPGSMIR